MKSAKFTLDQMFYTEFSVKANAAFKRDCEEYPTEPKVSIHITPTDENRYVVGMNLVKNQEVDADAYDARVVAIGIFVVDDDIEKQEQIALVVQSGPNILYGSIRDQIASLTARGPWGEYLLPPKVFEPDDYASFDGSSS
ncbi:protein-export chaperone SecB [Pseudomonas atacamensis]|uniref:protein-export chaperone SecB n=1 Tax=Pseudomonas TaxID=286 RepID=UPI0015A7A018|nr:MULTISPECIES: protein-export chaperone SecB [Pseudomonas]UVL16094.1 protein-export chaperone SecB [Pseudomonas atacamensis]